MLHVVSGGSDPLGGPPDFEPENAHELDAAEFAEGHHVAADGLVGIEAHEAAHRVFVR